MPGLRLVDTLPKKIDETKKVLKFREKQLSEQKAQRQEEVAPQIKNDPSPQDESGLKKVREALREESGQPELISEYEESLFKDGALIYDEKVFLENTREQIAQSVQWYERAGWDDVRSASSLRQEVIRRLSEGVWQKRFSSKIPKNWHTWYNVSAAFEQSEHQKKLWSDQYNSILPKGYAVWYDLKNYFESPLGVQADSVLIEAALCHPHHLLALAVGTNRKLSVEQLALVLYRTDIPSWNKEHVMVAQKTKFGLSDEELPNIDKKVEKLRDNPSIVPDCINKNVIVFKYQPLSKNLVDAAISHPHYDCALEVGTRQKLTEKQLTVVLDRGDVPVWAKRDIVDYQNGRQIDTFRIRKAEEYLRDGIESESFLRAQKRIKDFADFSPASKISNIANQQEQKTASYDFFKRVFPEIPALNFSDGINFLLDSSKVEEEEEEKQKAA